jgi:hypothetical protein
MESAIRRKRDTPFCQIPPRLHICGGQALRLRTKYVVRVLAIKALITDNLLFYNLINGKALENDQVKHLKMTSGYYISICPAIYMVGLILGHPPTPTHTHIHTQRIIQLTNHNNTIPLITI